MVILVMIKGRKMNTFVSSEKFSDFICTKDAILLVQCFFRFQGWLPPIDVNSYPIKYRSSNYTNTNSNVCSQAVLLQFQMYLLFYVSKHFLWFFVFFQHRQQWPESDSTGLGDDLHQQVMLWSDKMLDGLHHEKNFKSQNPRNLTVWGVFSAGPGRQLRLPCHRVWEIQESCVTSLFEIVVNLFEYGWFMDDEKNSRRP